jgi:alpha-L-arabinofuranosidase
MYSERFAPERVTADVVCSGYNVEGRDGAVPYLDVVATRDPEDGRVVLKVVNRHKEKDIAARINLELPRRYRVSKKAEVVTLNADALDAANSLDNPERVKVVQSSIDNVSKKFEHVFPAHSVTVIVMKAAR